MSLAWAAFPGVPPPAASLGIKDTEIPMRSPRVVCSPPGVGGRGQLVTASSWLPQGLLAWQAQGWGQWSWRHVVGLEGGCLPPCLLSVSCDGRRSDLGWGYSLQPQSMSHGGQVAVEPMSHQALGMFLKLQTTSPTSPSQAARRGPS